MRSRTVKTAALATVFAAAVAQLGAQSPRAPLSIDAPRIDAQQSVIRFGVPAQLAPQNPVLGPEEDVEGTLEVLIEDHAAGAVVHHFIDTARGRMRLREAPGDAQLAGLTTGTIIRARGRWAQDGTLELNNSSGGSSVTTMALASPNTFGPQKVVVIMVNFQDNASTPYAWTHAWDVTFNQASAFFAENSYGQTSLTGDVFGWFTIAMSSTTCDTNMISSLADRAATNAGVNLSQYTRKVYAFPSNACGWWGLGSVGGNPSRAWVNGSYALKVVAHELGHNFGDWHSNSMACESAGCTSSEYGHDRDMMGLSGTAHFNAYQKERLGWLNYGSSPAIQTVTASGTYYINSLPAAGSGPKALKILKSTTSSGNTFYYVEARTQTGFDSGAAPGVLISTGIDTTGNSSYQVDLDPFTSAFDRMLDPGQSFSDAAAGLTVRTVSIDAGGAWVQVDYAGMPCNERAPNVSLSPGGTVITSPSSTTTYTLSVRNNDDSTCAAASFDLAMFVPAGWNWSASQALVTIAPGASTSTTVSVTSPESAAGSVSIGAQAARTSTSGPGGSASATMMVATTLNVSLTITGSSSYQISATVLAGSTVMPGVYVQVVITNPRGGTTTLSGTTNSNGMVTVKGRLRGKDTRGTYQVTATASSGSLSGVAAGSFVY